MDFSDKKINSLQHLIFALENRPNMSGDELKKYFDGNAEQIQGAFNDLIEALNENNTEISDSINAKADATDVESSFDAVENVLNTKADKTVVESSLATKVNKEEGKTLSSNDYTTAEKEKLESLYNYDDSAVKAELSGKVDKQAGKDLSTNDYTNEEKAKLAGLPNVITDNLPELDYQELDNTETPYGIYKLINIPGEKTGVCDLLFVYYSDYDSGSSFETYYNQTRLCHDGTILKRFNVDDTSWSEWSEVKTPIVDSLTSTANYAALSANMGRVLSEKLEATLHYRGEIAETELPTENNIKGDVYKLTGSLVDKPYTTSKVTWQEYTYSYAIEGLYRLLTVEENEDINVAYETQGTTDFNLSVDFYTTDWEYVTTVEGVEYSESLLVFNVDGAWDTIPVGLEADVDYYAVRTDFKSPEYTLPTHSIYCEKTADYAIYNGESFDKFYNDETVDNKIAEVEEDYKNEIENAKRWKTLIDTTLTEEQGGVSSIKIEIPEPEMLKTITRMRILVDIQAGDEGIPSQTAKILIGDYNVNSYGCYFGWNTAKCDANKKLMYRGITEFLPINNNSTTKSRDTITFYSAPTIYESANANGNAIKIPSYLNTNLYNIRPPYFQVVLNDGGIMVAGTRIFVEVFE